MANSQDIKDPREAGTTGLKGVSKLDTLKQQLGLSSSPLEYIQTLLIFNLYNAPREDIGFVGVGDSTWDEGITSRTLLQDLNNTRGELQPWYAQIGAGLAKMGVLAGTTFVLSTLGTVVGGIQAIAEGDASKLWDNQISLGLSDINKWSEENIPNYYTNDERESPWYSNLGTANFWGDKLLKNMGFTIGAIGAGALTGGGLSTILSRAGNVGKLTTLALGTITSAAGEASIEAINSANDFEELNKSLILLEYDKSISNILSRYETMMQSIVASGSENSGLSIGLLRLLYDREIAELDARRLLLDKKVETDRDGVGNATFAGNMAVLSASNTMQFGRLLSGGFKNAKRALNVIARNTSGDVLRGTEEVVENLSKGTLEYAAKGGRKTAIALASAKNMLSEGFEEGALNIISNTALIKYSGDLNTFAGEKINPHVQDEVNGFMSATMLAYNELFGSIDSSGWEEVFLGGLTGIIGVPLLKRTKAGIRPTWAGGIKEAIEEVDGNRPSDEAISRINENLRNPDFITRYQGLIRHNSYLDKMDSSLASGDEFNYANNEISQLVSDAIMFREVDDIDALKGMVNQFSQLDDAAIQELREATQVEGSNKNIYDGMSNDQIRELIQTNAEKVSQLIDNIMNTHDSHLVQFGNNMTKELIEELTWMKVKIDDWNQRGTDYFNELKPLIEPALSLISQEAPSNELNNVNTFRAALANNNSPVIKELKNILDRTEKLASIKNSDKIEEYERQLLSLQEEYKNTEDTVEREAILERIKEFKDSKAGEIRKTEGFSNQLAINLPKIKELMSNIERSVDSANSFGLKYLMGVMFPDSLESTIAKDVDNSVKASQEVENNKNLDKLVKSKDWNEFKTNLVGLSPNERKAVLNQAIQHKDANISRMAKNLKDIDETGNSLINILGTQEFDNILDEDKIPLRDVVNNVMTTATSYEDLITKLRTAANELPTINKMVDLLEASREEKDSYKDNKKDASLTPRKTFNSKGKNPLDMFGTDADSEGDGRKRVVDDQADGVKRDATAAETPLEEPKKPNISKDIITTEDAYNLQNMFTEGGAEGLPLDIDKATLESFRDRYEKVMKVLLGEEKQDTLPEDMSLEEIEYWLNKYNESNTPKQPESPDLSPLNLMLEYTSVGDRLPLANTELLLSNDAVTEASIGEMINMQYIPFAEKNPSYKVIWDYLSNNGAFEFVNSGQLQLLFESNPNVPILLIVDKNLNSGDNLNNVVLLGVEINGLSLILGVLKTPRNSSSTLNLDVITEASKSEDLMYISPTTMRIHEIGAGRIATVNEDRDISVLNPTFAIAFDNDIIHAPTIEDGRLIRPSITNNQGRVYLMIPSANGRFIPTPALVKRFNETEYPLSEYGSTPVYRNILDALSVITDTSMDDKSRLQARDALEQHIYFGNKKIHWVRRKDGGLFIQISEVTYDEDGVANYELTKDITGKDYTVTLTEDVEANTNNVLLMIKEMSPRLLVDSRFLTSPEYVLSIVDSGVVTSNLMDYQVHNANFTIKPVGAEVVTPSNTEIAKKSANPVRGLEKYSLMYGFKGLKYRVYPSGLITKGDGTDITDRRELYVAYAWNIISNNKYLSYELYNNGRLYEFTIKGDTYGVLMLNGKITKLFEGDVYKKVKEDIKNKVVPPREEAPIENQNTSVQDLLKGGYNSSNYAVGATLRKDIFGPGAYFGIFNLAGEELMTLSLRSSEINNLKEAAGDLSLFDKQVNSLIQLRLSPSHKRGRFENVGLIESKEEDTNIDNKTVVNSLTNNLDNKNNSTKPLDNSQNISIFASLLRQDKVNLQKALKAKGINARTDLALLEQTSNYLGISSEELSALSVEEIITKINCK